MHPFAVVPYFHVLKDVLPGLLMALIVVVIDEFLLEGGMALTEVLVTFGQKMAIYN